MAVYVDDMRAPYGRLIMCHMIADSEDEIHAMAETIGVARKWYQGDHYDVCLSMRAKAVAAGAKELTWMQLGRITVQRRLDKASLARGEPPVSMDDWDD